jgi:hypothetical protein
MKGFSHKARESSVEKQTTIYVFMLICDKQIHLPSVGSMYTENNEDKIIYNKKGECSIITNYIKCKMVRVLEKSVQQSAKSLM